MPVLLFLQVDNLLGDKVPVTDTSLAKLHELINFVQPLDVQGSREKSVNISSRSLSAPNLHFAHDDGDSHMIDRLKAAASSELLIMEAVQVKEQCKELSTFLSKTGYKAQLDNTTKNENPIRWNSMRFMFSSLQRKY